MTPPQQGDRGTPSPGANLERVVLHVGLYKTGTTYLQNLLRENRRSLRRSGIYLPPRRREVTFAALDLIDRQFRGTRDARVPGAWDRLAAAVYDSGLPTAIISEERLSVATPRQVRRAVAAFASAQVDVVVTVRDLSRVLVSHWQEEVKNGATWTLPEYADALRDPEGAGSHPARGFWMHEDVTAVLRAWGSAVPVERIHVVTVPPAGAPSGLLAERFGSVAGFKPRDVAREGVWTNENVGAVGTELIRRLNERIGDQMHGIEHERGVKIPLSRALAAMSSKGAVAVPAEHREWAGQTASTYVQEIRAGGYDVVGDLDDLQPMPAVGEAGQPGEPGDAALLEAALEGLSALVLRQGKVLAAADRVASAQRGDLAGRRTRMVTRARNLSFRAKRAAADLAGRSRTGRRLTAAYVRRRAGR
ncbi:MAG TPA: hypothetical protein VNP20_22000 [Nocardioidaceae bacterium]|nr:hypothetical protein [Nocardioidaceae bacterium]